MGPRQIDCEFSDPRSIWDLRVSLKEAGCVLSVDKKKSPGARPMKGLAQARPDEAAKKRPTHSRRTKQRAKRTPFRQRQANPFQTTPTPMMIQ